MFRLSLAAVLLLGVVCPALAQENTAAACSNGADDDRDGAPDCSDLECRFFVFCAQAQPQAPMMAPPQQMMPQQPSAGAPGYEGAYARARDAWYRQNYGYVPQGAYVPPGSGGGYGMQPGYGQPGYGGTHPSWVLVGTGIATFAVGWIGQWSMALALARGSGGLIGTSFIPLAGPWIGFAFGLNTLGIALAITFGVTQITGLLLTIIGLAVEERDAMPFALLPWFDRDGGGAVAGFQF
jgi:hypothetical protein